MNHLLKPLCIVYADNDTFSQPDIQRFVAGLRDEGMRVVFRNPQGYTTQDREPAKSVYIQHDYIGKGIVTDYDGDPNTETIEILEEVMPKFFAYQDRKQRIVTRDHLTSEPVDVDEALTELHARGLLEPRQLAPGEMLQGAPLPDGATAIEVPADGVTRDVVLDSTGGKPLAPADDSTITKIVTTELDPTGTFPISQTSTPATTGETADATVADNGNSADERSNLDCGQEGHAHADAEEVQACKEYYSSEDHPQSNPPASNTSADDTPAKESAGTAELPVVEPKADNQTPTTEAPARGRSGGSRQRKAQ